MIISNPCSAAVFQTTPAPLVNMSVTMLSLAIFPQTVTIKTDVENNNPNIVCSIIVTLSPAAAFISLSGDYKIIALNAALIALPSDIGTHTFVLTVFSADFPGAVTQQTYTFNVLIFCSVTSITLVGLPDVVYKPN